MDETSRAKGHDYISLFVDLERKRTVYIADGKGSETVKDFAKDLEEHRGSAKMVTEVSCDMSPAFIKGVKENLTNKQFERLKAIKLWKINLKSIRYVSD